MTHQDNFYGTLQHYQDISLGLLFPLTKPFGRDPAMQQQGGHDPGSIFSLAPSILEDDVTTGQRAAAVSAGHIGHDKL